MKPHSVLNRLLLVLLGSSVAAMPVLPRAQSVDVGVGAMKADAQGTVREYEHRALVVELDVASRTVILRDPKGRVVTVDVPADVKNFDQVRIGDNMVVRYITAVAMRMEPATASGIRERVESGVSAVGASGSLPAAGRGRTVEVLAVVESLDRKARTATLRGTRRTVTVAIPTNLDVSRIKVGDQVRAVFAEAAVVSFQSAASK